MSQSDPVKELDRAIDLIDKIESLVARLASVEGLPKGTVFQLYQSVVELRELIVGLRMRVFEEQGKAAKR